VCANHAREGRVLLEHSQGMQNGRLHVFRQCRPRRDHGRVHLLEEHVRKLVLKSVNLWLAERASPRQLARVYMVRIKRHLVAQARRYGPGIVPMREQWWKGRARGAGQRL